VLWGQNPPRTCLQQIHVGRLRRLLEPDRGPRAPGRLLRRQAGGYLLDAEPDQVDLTGFLDLAARARDAWGAGAAESASQLYQEAWACWRGPVLSGAGAQLLRHPSVVAVAQRRVTTLLGWADVAFSLGSYEHVIAPLRAVYAEQPLHEALAARLLVALAGGGQQAEALGLYRSVRGLLDEQLGVSPGPELRAAHLRVLRHRLPVEVRSATASGPRDAPPSALTPADSVPSQLPADVVAFTGRSADLGRLAELEPAGNFILQVEDSFVRRVWVCGIDAGGARTQGPGASAACGLADAPWISGGAASGLACTGATHCRGAGGI